MTEQEALERIKQADLDVRYALSHTTRPSSGYPYREYRHWQVSVTSPSEEALSAETLLEAVQNYVLFLEERIERDWRVLGILAPTIDERSKPYP